MTTIATEERAPRRRGTINKRAILDASAAMFHEKGYDRTTLDDIAGMLSVTKPSLYYYFANKEDILIECVRSAFEYFTDELARRDDVAFTGRRRVEIFLRLYLDVITHDIGVSMVQADARVMGEGGSAAYADLRRTLNRGLEDRIKQGIADGSLVADESKLTTFAIFGMFNWVATWNFRRNRMPLDEIYARFAAILFDGIGAR